MTEMYAQFFRFPVFDLPARPAGGGAGACGSAPAAAVLGTLAAVRRAVVLPPAEAMRPEPPADVPADVRRAARACSALFSAAGADDPAATRPPAGAGRLTCFGIALAVRRPGAWAASSRTRSTTCIDFQFFRVQRHDVTLAFVEPASPSGVCTRPSTCRACAASSRSAACRSASGSARHAAGRHHGLVPDPATVPPAGRPRPAGVDPGRRAGHLREAGRGARGEASATW